MKKNLKIDKPLTSSVSFNIAQLDNLRYFTSVNLCLLSIKAHRKCSMRVPKMCPV